MKRYCEHCEKEVDVQQRFVTQSFMVKDRKVRASIKILLCPECHQEVFDEATEKQNELLVFSKYNTFCKNEAEKLHIGADGRLIRKQEK